MVGSGQPEEYKAGFRNGCDSGYSAAGNIYYSFTKDVRRYSEDRLYRQGWDDGMTHCRASYDASKNSMWR